MTRLGITALWRCILLSQVSRVSHLRWCLDIYRTYSESQEGRVYILTHFQTYPLLKILYDVPVSLTGVKVNGSEIENHKITLLLGNYLVRRMFQCSLVFKCLGLGVHYI